MKRIQLCGTLLFLMVLASPTEFGLSQENEYRVFTNKEGKTIDARVGAIAKDTRMVTIVMRDGRRFEIEGNSLSLDDQQFLKEWEARRKVTISGSGDDATISAGRLHYFGRLNGDRKIDVSAVSEISDFVEVKAMKHGWIAKRAGGEYIFFEPKKQGFPPLRDFYANTIWSVALAEDGTVWRTPEEQVLGEVLNDIQVVAAAGKNYAAIRSNGELVTWGGAYSKQEPEKLHWPNIEMGRAVDLAQIQGGMAAIDSSGRVFCWSLKSPAEITGAKIGEGLVDIESGIFVYTGLTRTGEVYQWSGVNPENAKKAKVPEALESGPGKYKRIKSGGVTYAAQKMDGTWTAWGKDGPGIIEKIKEIGKVKDLAVFTEPGSNEYGYLVWIE